MRANSLDRIWKNPDKHYGTRALSGRGLRLVLFDRAKGRCEGCRAVLTFTAPPKTWIIDHIVPVFKGGATTMKNLQILCKRCDNRKTAKEKSEAAFLRHKALAGPDRRMTHYEKDLFIANLIAERDALKAQLAAQPTLETRNPG